MRRWYYSSSVDIFLRTEDVSILGVLAKANEFDLTQTQRDAWADEIKILKANLSAISGTMYFEYSIPRMGKRIDVVLLTGAVIFVLEFKVGERFFVSSSEDQVCDYALDLKNFHESSQQHWVAPILVATEANVTDKDLIVSAHHDRLMRPIRCNALGLNRAIQSVMDFATGEQIEPCVWEGGRYCPTPTIVEAAIALYGGHAVADVSRSDASAINLSDTSGAIAKIIADAQRLHQKSICFVTGVPGAGKTLVGLDIATKHIDKSNELYSVFLSGNGPLVAVMQEALARDKIRRDKEQGKRTKKYVAKSEVKLFIQNVHHFRDDCLSDTSKPPIEHVALFDEAQRAWHLTRTADFMRRKKGVSQFSQSEPEFLISCLDRHHDWATVVCLVGGGQEINTGEAGISEWIDSLNRRFPHWHVYISPRLTDSEYGAGGVLNQLKGRANVDYLEELHLSVSMRSFRAENVSTFVKDLLDINPARARLTLAKLSDKYSIVLTRDLQRAKQWVRENARGTERYGLVVSSQAQRLKPYAIDVKTKVDPIHWFLDGKDDVRSSYYLEDVATEFHVQGLEVDWACVAWDADFRFRNNAWEHRSFSGNRWRTIKNAERQTYQKNAYRVLLTRARQGMVITVPNGDITDPTRKAEYYDSTFEYLRGIGLKVI